MIELSYSTFGLTNVDFLDSITEVDKAGYPGIELAFHRDHFNPFNVTDEYVGLIKKRLSSVKTKAACVATASHFFTPSRPHEPSLMSPDLAGRKRRIDLIRRGIELARKLDVPLVTFGSGFIRDEHLMNPSANPRELLVDSIHQCLASVRDDEDITLLIEPEPGMFIETIEQGLSLIDEVNSPKFQLHVDMCHLYCSDKDYVGALAKAAPYARFLHVSDARRGYNLKILKMADDLEPDLDFANYLIYFPEFADYLLLDADHPIYFCDEPPSKAQEKQLHNLLDSVHITKKLTLVNYGKLDASVSAHDDEIFTYLISVPGLSYDVLERARPIILYLRTTRDTRGKLLMDKMVANTLTGIVHFHEVPGEGTMDFAASFKALVDNGFSGYASVELYHHVASWEQAMNDSFKHLSQFV
ncbi:sugar phosphate isomerase/epimerase family protein [Mycobacterium riyadhense]|uniref:Xylose isomerase n=1 Tax=Mycobacterium riyadhense TaxID=486698 RepID=A0A1X2B7J0_9MYCO|nr:sugar phosphate isomerase/epimerase family protein [Mycobacterium riyadhense]MCV7145863.1 TIM barrel protein [Mycobacterium riyadhense]ORW59640.1 xylose isomerase [Mycobacterium riyadhense]